MRCCTAMTEGAIEITFCRETPPPSGRCPKGVPRLIADEVGRDADPGSSGLWARIETACRFSQAECLAPDITICFPFE